MTTTVSEGRFATLREFVRERLPVDHCELCATALDTAHDHLLDTDTRLLRCACFPCGRVLGGTAAGRWRLVRRRVERLVEFRLTDDEWQALGLPIDLAFLGWSSARGRVVALYPSPGGPVESSLALPAWDRLVAGNPRLAGLQPDVEALLVNRAGGRRDHYLVSIDECYRLVGLMRRHWQGFGGGTEVQGQIDQFFAALDQTGAHP